MTRWLTLCLTTLLFVTIPAVARESDKWVQTEYLPGRLIVDFAPTVKIQVSPLDEVTIVTGVASLDELFQEIEVTAARRLVPDGILDKLRVPPDLYHTFVVEYGNGFRVLDILDRFAANENVHWVEPDLVNRTFRIPNDSYWTQQWDKRIVGAPAVWDVNTGSRAIICAGIDTGVDWDHPDFVGNLWVNPGEDLDHDSAAWSAPDYPGDMDDVDGEDSDGNGFIDDLLGWDFIHGIGGCATGEDCDNATDNDMRGQNPHGTHVAGLMVAHGNNSIGVAGMSWNGRLMALRAGYEDSQHNGYIPESASGPAILYAAANGARVLNMSYGGAGSSNPMQQVMTSAWNQGCILFAASGNDGSTTPQYPANYENVIAVNATDSNDHLASWSNRGTWTDLCSPGAEPGIMSTVINGYGIMEGTSMASPNAAGVAALVWSVFPQMTNAELRDLLFNTAENINAHNAGIPPSYLGHGRVSAEAAVASLYPQMRITAFSLNDSAGGDGDGRLEAGETAQLYLTCTNVTGYANGDSISAVITAPDPNLSVSNGNWYIGDLLSGQSLNNWGSPVAITAASTLDSAYWFDVRVTFSSPNGYVDTQPVTLRIGRGRVLIVDDDGTSNFEQYFVSGLGGAGASCDAWSVATDGAVSSEVVNAYAALLWSCGNQQSATLTAADQAVLSSYLDAGGNLIVVGQNVDEDLRGTPFYANYLHAETENLAGNRELNGVAGNPQSDGMYLFLGGAGGANNGTLSPSRILPVGGAQALFNYTQGGVGAVQYSGTYKTAYFAFALEAECGINNSDRIADVLGSVLRWMGALSAPETPHLTAPSSVALHGNYPNPFNPTTTISFDLTSPVHVSLRVFDVLGRSVATLVDGPLGSGSHSVVFDGAHLASGVYVTRLQAGSVTLSSKMVLMK